MGTFILIFAATAGPIVNEKYKGVESLIGNAACAGLAVMIIILSTGHISGAHLNPSLTLAFAALRHFPWAHVPGYVVAQVSGSICASFLLKAVFHPFLSGGVTVPTTSNGQAFALEFFITFILLFVVTAVATDTRAVSYSYIIVSTTYFLFLPRLNTIPNQQHTDLRTMFMAYEEFLLYPNDILQPVNALMLKGCVNNLYNCV